MSPELNPQEAGMEEVAQLFRQESSQVAIHLRSVMGVFLESCGKYLRLVDSLRLGIGSGKTKLDKYRFQMCRSNVVSNTYNTCSMLTLLLKVSKTTHLLP